jgi:microsomal dipeptidase-like Zn-dependent dipeptidase
MIRSSHRRAERGFIGRALTVLLFLLAIAVAAAFAFVPGALDRGLNRVVGPPLPPPSSRAAALFASLRVVDLHADSLLWDRDLSRRQMHGHVDLPRLAEGNVALQVFGVVTQAPVGLNFEHNEASAPDMITGVAIVQRWPRATWTSRTARAVYQARQLDALATRSNGRFVVVRTRADLQRFLDARASDPQLVAGLLGIEGAQALDGRSENLDALFDAGIRMIGLAHFTDNAVAGSSAGAEKGGLTRLGREVVRRMEKLGIALDLAHVAPPGIDDALALANKPVFVSHGGLQSYCKGPRNLSDAHARAIAATGGVIGIGYFAETACGTAPADVARALRAAKDVVGARHIALGSDFDGAVTTAFDTTQLASLVDALFAQGFDEDEIRGAMGENALRVLGRTLP